MKRRNLRSLSSWLGLNNESFLSKADLSRVPFVVTHTMEDNSGISGLSRRKLDVYICYSRMVDKDTVDRVMAEIEDRVKVRGMEDAVDLASAKINTKGAHDTVVTIGNVAIRGLDSKTILDTLDKSLDELLYDAMYQAKRDFSKPQIS